MADSKGVRGRPVAPLGEDAFLGIRFRHTFLGI